MHKSTHSIDMPGSYYWEGLDNFFHKLTAMESPRKNNDCYFYYYSTCTKGDNCTFRHEPSALGCETMCSYWQQGKCLNQHCNFRHMELRKNRKAIPCYWETQPSGCRKPHCPFQHKNPREPPVNVEPPTTPAESANEQKDRPDWNRRQVVLDNNQYEQPSGEITNNEIECARPASRRISQTSSDATSYGSPSVDPLVVNFEEESDNESTTTIPVKLHQPSRNEGVKTLEEIRLEKVQAESAAFYSYNDINLNIDEDTGQEFRRRTNNNNRFAANRKVQKEPTLDFEVLSLNEIRKRKTKTTITSTNITTTTIQPAKSGIVKLGRKNWLEPVRKVLERAKQQQIEKQPICSNFDSIKVKTLAEIRAERAQKANNINAEEPALAIKPPGKRRLKRSLSNDERLQETFLKRKLLRKKSYNDISSATHDNDDGGDDKMAAAVPASTWLPDNLDMHIDLGVMRRTDNDHVSNLVNNVPDLVVDVQSLAAVIEPNSRSPRFTLQRKMDEDVLLDHSFDGDQRMSDSSITLRPADDILQDIDALLGDD